jgi:uncharacterized tellurite resistance protein B-like protein
LIARGSTDPSKKQIFMQNLHAIKSAILADGKIDAEETAMLRQILFADGKIEQAEADLLFELNNKCSVGVNDPSWTELFVEAISSFLLDDQDSPDEIDATESAWLLQQVMGDGKLDETEKTLLQNLNAQAKKMPGELVQFIKANI